MRLQRQSYGGAPIRHRFSQIFDEIGIHSEWRFAAEWLEQPTQLECLTLQRVAEEALSNIMKHSQATRVLVQLYFYPSRQLILEIEDTVLDLIVKYLTTTSVWV